MKCGLTFTMLIALKNIHSLYHAPISQRHSGFFSMKGNELLCIFNIIVTDGMATSVTMPEADVVYWE